MRHFLKPLTFAVACLAASAFLAAPSAEAQIVSEIQLRRDWQMDGLRFHNRFCGARLSELIRIEEGHYVAVSRPEYRPINPSPWYALEIESPEAREIRLAIRIDSAGPDHEVLWPARPWLSGDDGKTWRPLDAAAWQRGTDLATATLSLPAGRLRISAWKPYTLADCAAWCETLAARPDVRAVHVGWSAEGREIRAFHAAGPGSPPRYLAVLGGQHPPEITGDLGLTHFVGELLGESELAGEFRRAYRTVILPRINPDGKHHGHWRGTLGGKDPNRDWFDRTLPEIQAVTRHFETLAAGEGAEMVMAIDFHSTNADFFYVEAPGTIIRPADFTARWMQAVREDPQGHEPEIIPGAIGPGASRPWFSQRFGIPSYTREFSYSQSEREIAARCRAEARALMRLLLAHAKSAPPGP